MKKLLLLVVSLTLLGAAPAALAQTCVVPSKDPTQCSCPLGDIDAAGVFTPRQGGTCTLPLAQWLQPLPFATQPRFAYDLPVPVFYTPDQTTFQGADYYEIEMKEVTQAPVAFPQPATAAPPDKQWLGLCTAGTFNALTGVCASPIFTPVWGYGQAVTNMSGGPLGGIATYPSMSFLAMKDRPVKVKWVNALQKSTHLLCPEPQNSDVPCAIDRTLMGTLRKPGETVNPYGTVMQPDNAMVVHLHGGEIPPDSDGFAELWIGNATTAAAYGPGGAYYTAPTPLLDRDGAAIAGATTNLDPLFVPSAGNAIPSDAAYALANWDGAVPGRYTPGQLVRPVGNSIYYNYPMVQPSATIWYHDHALGKTRINVAAGPAGYFYIQTPGIDSFADSTRNPPIPRGSWYPSAAGPGLLPEYGDCSTGGVLANKCYDIPIVLQDRAFNADGTINFPNGLGQIAPVGVVGWNPLVPGPNPDVHPQWVPEYFGDLPVVNGVIWPKLQVEPRPYRFRLLDGSNARCYSLSLKPALTTLLKPTFIAIASDQGYLPTAVPVAKLDMCPGERYEVVVDFSQFAGMQIILANSAGAPYPNGIGTAGKSPFAGLAQLMRFDVLPAVPATSPAAAPYTLPVNFPIAPLAAPLAPCDQTFVGGCLPAAAKSREMVLNEVLDPVTLAPVRVQIDGRAFEFPVTETPNEGTTEVWSFVNTTVDAHPMHLHLVQFQVVSRQKFDTAKYGVATGLVTPTTGAVWNKVPVAPFLLGRPMKPLKTELGFKDTVISYPGEVTTVIAKWEGKWATAPTATSQMFWEPVTAGPYVWHCHIVDHEDNEMMRPSLVLPATAAQPAIIPAGGTL